MSSTNIDGSKLQHIHHGDRHGIARKRKKTAGEKVSSDDLPEDMRYVALLDPNKLTENINATKTCLGKGGVVLLLIVQTTTAVLLLRYLKTREKNTFISTTAVYMSEMFKLVTAGLISWYNIGSADQTLRQLADSYVDNWDVIMPAMIYSVQNNLIYIAGSKLDAATFQVTSQLKILTTATCMVLFLKIKLSSKKIMAIIVLFVGVCLVQLNSVSFDAQSVRINTEAIQGLLAITIAATTSAVAGVYLEHIYKRSGVSMWILNVQLASVTVFFCAIGMMLNDGRQIIQEGLFSHYNPLVWVLILTQVLGGFLVAAVIKKYDNIVKGFATSGSLVVAYILSIVFLDSKFSITSMLGTILVAVSVMNYVQ